MNLLILVHFLRTPPKLRLQLLRKMRISLNIGFS
jgi:hypothetical protein